mmetsp:Transcript_14191/g.22591  ORF Transcript_14191/g.22591 Transcript_14191/m.22591 type:complete len:393 (-) Transcript_14191:40-1218(-)
MTLSLVNPVDDSKNSPWTDPLVSPVEGITLEKITLQNTGMTLRVAMAGPRTGKPVLFMHGFPESWFSWRHQLLALATAGYFAIAPDMRGYGHSDAPESSADYTCHHIASDMIGLMQQLGLTKTVLVGHDWGAALTWLLGKLYPSYFPVIAALSVPTNLREQASPSPMQMFNQIFGTGKDRLFFYQAYHQETFPGTSDHGPAEAEYDSNIYESIFRFWSDKTVPQTISKALAASNKRRDGGMIAHMPSRPERLPHWLSQNDIDYVVEQFKHHGFRGGVNYYRNMHRNHCLTPQLVGHKVQQPCLFLTGEDDPVIAFGPGGLKGQQERLKAACADLRSCIVLKCEDEDGKRSAGHWIQQERAAEVNAHLLSFLKNTAVDFDSALGAMPTSISKL